MALRQRSIDPRQHRITEFDSVQGYLRSKGTQPGITTIHSGGFPIDFLTKPVDSDTTVFFFHGAMQNPLHLPVLSGGGISQDLNANRVFISDPSLVVDDTLLLGWYAGNQFQPTLQQDLVKIFRKILQDLGSTRAVFFGGSGGGFAALFFASFFENSLALFFNPQTILRNYSRPSVVAYAEKAFGIPAITENPLEFLPSSVTQNLCTVYRQPKPATIAYMQNELDPAHITGHLEPFKTSVHPDNKFLLLTHPWEEGHKPPPKSLLAQLLQLAVDSTDWVTDLQENSFIDMRR